MGRINSYTTATSTASDDYFNIDGTTNGTRKMSAHTPVFSAATGSSLTGPSTTDLTLSGGSSGASLVLGQGEGGAPKMTIGGGDLFIHTFSEEGSTGQNTFVGEGAGNETMSTGGGDSNLASVNTGVGWHALSSITTGYANAGVGVRALDVTTTGHTNSALGEGALRYNTTGSSNVGIGHGAGYNNTTGSFNIYIGRLTGSDSASDIQNAIAIGNAMSAPASNTTVIGTGTTTDTYFGGITGLSALHASSLTQAVTNGNMSVAANGTGNTFLGGVNVGGSTYFGLDGSGAVKGAFIESRGRDVSTVEGWLTLVANTANAAATGGIIRLVQYNGSTYTETGRVSKAGNLLVGTTADTGLTGAGGIKANTKVLANAGIGVGNSAAATTLGSVARKMEVFDMSGASIGFVPLYNAIT